MQYTCPVCQTAGEISADSLTHPFTKTSCQNCKSILLINPDTGHVETHKAAIKDDGSPTTSDIEASRKSASFGSRQSPVSRERDWTAIWVLVGVVAALVAAGLYLTFNFARSGL